MVVYNENNHLYVFTYSTSFLNRSKGIMIRDGTDLTPRICIGSIQKWRIRYELGGGGILAYPVTNRLKYQRTACSACNNVKQVKVGHVG